MTGMERNEGLVAPLLRRVTKSPLPRGSEEAQISKKAGATMTGTIINLLKNMIGAGLLNVCIAFKYSSVVGGLFAMLFCSFVCTAGFLLIGLCCSKVDAKSFRELWRLSIGRYEKVIDVTLFFHCLFSCVGYITLIGDFCVKSLSGLFPHSAFATRRDIPIYVITLTTLLPLSLLRSLEPLKYTSAIGLFVTACACAYVLYDCLTVTDVETVGVLRDHMFYLRPDIFKTIALFNGSFSAHYNAPTFYAELKDRSFRRFTLATLCSFLIATVVFTVFGLAGFARFGDAVLGNILKSYTADNVMVQLCWLCMMIATVFVFPLAFQRMRTSFTALVNKPANIHAQSPINFTTLMLLALCVYLGTAFDDIAVIKMIKGATLGVSIMFIFPAMFCLSLARKSGPWALSPWLQFVCVLLLLSGIMQGTLALLVHYKVI
eukprot:TRINITY_DN13147_c0_g1_i1.p1 TRINITY_DN13147_c0_g1~~TRINITY_DN13147_c0_g1_i1.p1  ORF type:complete len:451 (-),score=65.53 TRINITY_DN13147_c0_g1_i1:142-1437(-)